MNREFYENIGRLQMDIEIAEEKMIDMQRQIENMKEHLKALEQAYKEEKEAVEA
jgi:hypothetical protein